MKDILIKAYKPSDKRHEVHIYTGEGDFIGQGYMKEIDDKTLMVDGSVARPKFGKYVYDFMAMYAHSLNKGIVSDIENGASNPAINNWKKLSKNKLSVKRVVPKIVKDSLLSRGLDKVEFPFMYESLSIPSSSIYKDSLVTNEDFDSSEHKLFRDLKEKYERVFFACYEDESNKWINDVFPMNEDGCHAMLNSDIDKVDLKEKISKYISYDSIDNADFDNNITHNLEYHSVRHNGDLTVDSNREEIFNKLFDKFVKEVSHRVSFDGENLKLYRALGLNGIENLNPELGIHWSYDVSKTFVFDDVGYDHKDINKGDYERYIIASDVNLKDVDWMKTFEFYFIQEFGECEIVVNKDAKFNNIKYKVDSDNEFQVLPESKFVVEKVISPKIK